MRAAAAFLSEFMNNAIVVLPPPKKSQKQTVPDPTLEDITAMVQQYSIEDVTEPTQKHSNIVGSLKLHTGA
ncbi:hypothetical protein F441_09822, partial [Phytophthora nicotianae CJ01A1]